MKEKILKSSFSPFSKKEVYIHQIQTSYFINH